MAGPSPAAEDYNAAQHRWQELSAVESGTEIAAQVAAARTLPPFHPRTTPCGGAQHHADLRPDTQGDVTRGVDMGRIAACVNVDRVRMRVQIRRRHRRSVRRAAAWPSRCCGADDHGRQGEPCRPIGE